MRGIKVLCIVPNWELSTGKINGVDTQTVFVYNYKDIEVYKLFSIRDSVFKDRTITHILPHFLVYRKGEKLGYDYMEGNESGNKVVLDSILKFEWIAHVDIDIVLGNSNIITPLNSYQSKNLDTLKESYFIRNKNKPQQSASVFIEYCKSLMDIEFTFAKKLEEVKKMKLYKIRVINNISMPNDTLKITKYEADYELQRMNTFNDQEVLKYIDKYNAEK